MNTQKKALLTKLYLFCIIPISCIIIYILFYFPQTQSTLSLDAAETRLTRFTESLSLTIGICLYEVDFEKVNSVVDWVKKDKNVFYIGIIDEKNYPIFEYNSALNQNIFHNIYERNYKADIEHLMKIFY
jgi:hypothetical protein